MNIMQHQYDLIYSFFKTTTEPFDGLEWDGKILNVWLNEKIIFLIADAIISSKIVFVKWRKARYN